MDIKETYNEINEMARKMVTSTGEEQAFLYRTMLVELVMKNLTNFESMTKAKHINEKVKVYFLAKKSISQDAFVEILMDSVSKNNEGKWKYKIEKDANYITYLSNLLNRRALDHPEFIDEELQMKNKKNKTSKDASRVYSLDAMLSSDSEENPNGPRNIKSEYTIEIDILTKQVQCLGYARTLLDKLQQEEKDDKLALTKDKILIRCVYDIMDFIRNKLDQEIYQWKKQENGGTGYGMKFEEEERVVERNQILHMVPQIDRVVAMKPDELEFFLVQKAENCYEIYYNSLKESVAITYEYLNQYLNQYLRSQNQKEMKLDNMKKWYRKHYDEVFLSDVRKYAKKESR